ncbi:MAG: signal recognition particle-docking protein FtsY [Gammaproteobacteria bacterium]|nr:signal recognition particle-docking protein FtsY [Gammaproteobacteria bacterium]
MTSDDTAAPKSPERGGLFALFRRRKDSAESAAPLQPTPEPAPEARVASLADGVADSGLATPAVVVEKPAPIAAPAQGEEPARRGLFRRALARTGAGLGNLLLGRKAIDAELYEELETSLLMADVGVETASAVIAELTARVKRRNLGDAQALRGELRALLLELLEPCQQPLVIDRQTPFVMLVVGVNGVGKTTTIGKLAHRLQSEGRTLMLAAGDTFRAAAVEQLQAWGERNRVPVVSQGTGADSASVIFDAIQSAQARQLDVVIADTAGRLHTKDNLMAELTKVRRVMAKLDPDAPHETLLVLDAGTGQNAVVQMRQFSAAVAVTGIALTKLDGTAKGGVIFALCREFGVPIRYVGLGEGIDDLQPFDAELFVDALLATSDNVG